MRIEIELSSLEDLIADYQSALANAQLGLGMWVGVPGSKLEATDRLEIGDLPTLEPEDSNLKTENSRVRAARALVAQQESFREIAGRAWIPSLALSGGAKSVPLEEDSGWGYIAGISFGLPIFDNGQAKRQLADAQLRQARAGLAWTELQTATDIATAHEAFARSMLQARVFEENQLPRLEKLSRSAEVSYKAGESLIFELIDAHRTQREVGLRHIQLKLQTRLDHIDLLEALGQEPGGAK